MRLAKVSLLILTVMTAVNGCSQSRDSVRRGRFNSMELQAPTPNQSYNPGIYESNPGAQPVAPHVPPAPSFEPPRVPPAVGVSRVKSVGFPRLLNSPAPTPKPNCGETIVSCCPEVACTPRCQPECVRNEGCVISKPQSSRLAKFFAPLTQKFSRKPAGPCGTGCGSATCSCRGEKCQPAVGCGDQPCQKTTCQSCVPGRVCQTQMPQCGCGDQPGLIAPGCGDRPWRDYATKSNHQPGLAESLQDPFLDNEAVQVPGRFQQRTLPTAPVHQIPEDAPLPPAIYLPNTSTQLVIPPQWPRLTQNNYAGIN